ncbi:MAG: ABC transporter ATP-binding protein [Burkholderiales bacterium]|nr:ABC transporter ATP-binding protein [Burkholderiales bacterium]
MIRRAMNAEAGYLRIEAVSKRFGETLAVDDVSLAIRRREIFALLGSSGCGKSTLLRMVAGLESPDAGRIVLDGEDLATVPVHRRPTNMMFQSYALFPHMSVAGNVAFGLRQERPRMARAMVHARVAEMLELVQMQHLAERRPHELSGGQQQRAALARSLAREPKLLLLDEPLSALDKKIRQRTQLELVNLVRRVGVTCIIVTHDQEEAMVMADRIGVMSPRGQMLQVGAPGEVYEHPVCRYAAEFVGETNLFEGRIEQGRLRCDGWPMPLALPPSAGPGGAPAEGEPAWLSVRPERLRLLRSEPAAATALDNRIAGRVADIAYLGSHSIYHVGVGEGVGEGGSDGVGEGGARVLVASVPCVPPSQSGEAPPPARGEAVWLAWSGLDGVVLRR